MFILTPVVYVEYEEKFEMYSTRPFAFVDSKFNNVIFDSMYHQTPLLKAQNFTELSSNGFDKLIIYTSLNSYWNVLYSVLSHIVINVFNMDEKYIEELYESYQIKFFQENGFVTNPFSEAQLIELPHKLLPHTFSDCGFEFLVFYGAITGKNPIDEKFGKKITTIVNKWTTDRLRVAVTGLLKYDNLIDKSNTELYALCSMVLRSQPLSRAQQLSIFSRYLEIGQVKQDIEEYNETDFLVRYLSGEVSVVECFEFLKENKIKAFTTERAKINEWILYKCFSKKS